MNCHQRHALEDFDRAYHHAVWADRLAILCHRRTRLRAFQDDRRRFTVRGERALGLSSVPVDRIVGSTERCGDFDTVFRPLRACSAHRWVSVARAHGEGRGLPPVQLYRLGDAYYVRDGHHRVSVARVRGQILVEAEVTEVLTYAPRPAALGIEPVRGSAADLTERAPRLLFFVRKFITELRTCTNRERFGASSMSNATTVGSCGRWLTASPFSYWGKPSSLMWRKKRRYDHHGRQRQ